jgi:two-component system response regulator FixJ
MKPTLYVVEDDEAVRISLQALLEILGHRVTTFAAGEEFLARADMNPGNCVILDVNLPGASGLEILKRLRDGGNLMPAFVMSGRASNHIRARAKQLGARGFFEKPLEIDDLIAAIDTIDAPAKCRSDAGGA